MLRDVTVRLLLPCWCKLADTAAKRRVLWCATSSKLITTKRRRGRREPSPRKTKKTTGVILTQRLLRQVFSPCSNLENLLWRLPKRKERIRDERSYVGW